MISKGPPRERPQPLPRPKPDATIGEIPVRLMAIEELPPTAILVVEVTKDINSDGVERIRQILMDRLAVRDVLIFCNGVKLAGVYDVPGCPVKPEPPPNRKTRDGDTAPT